MVREYGPFRERFEEYIVERTTDYPSVVPMIMEEQGKAPCLQVLVPREGDGSSGVGTQFGRPGLNHVAARRCEGCEGGKCSKNRLQYALRKEDTRRGTSTLNRRAKGQRFGSGAVPQRLGNKHWLQQRIFALHEGKRESGQETDRQEEEVLSRG